jgi:hypothetical protein
LHHRHSLEQAHALVRSHIGSPELRLTALDMLGRSALR